MGVSHRGITEWREVKGWYSFSKITSSNPGANSRVHTSHPEAEAEAGRRSSRQREGLQSGKRPHPGHSTCHFPFDSPAGGSSLSHFALTRSQELSGLWLWPGGGTKPTLEFWGFVPMRDMAGTQASDVTKSSALPRTEGGSVIPDSWSHWVPKLERPERSLYAWAPFVTGDFLPPEAGHSTSQSPDSWNALPPTESSFLWGPPITAHPEWGALEGRAPRGTQ